MAHKACCASLAVSMLRGRCGLNHGDCQNSTNNGNLAGDELRYINPNLRFLAPSPLRKWSNRVVNVAAVAVGPIIFVTQV